MRSFTKVFLIIFVPIFIALLLTFYFSHRLIVNDARHELVQEMSNMWCLLEPQSDSIVELSAGDYQRMVDLTKKTSLRITLIQHDGTVLLDSLVAYDKIAQLENHKNRPEVKLAIYDGEGWALRYSKTKQMEMLYFARALRDGRILRLSYPNTYVVSLQHNFTRQAVYSFIFLSITVLLLALYFARKVSLPIQKLNYIADNIEADRRNIHFPHFKDPSMAKIAGLIYRIYSSMQQKNIALNRDQQKLTHIFTNMNQGVLLLDDENSALYINPWLEHELGTTVEIDTNLFNATNEVPLINFFTNLVQQDAANFRSSFNKKIFEVSLKKVAGQKLLLLRNVTAQVEYETYKEQLTANVSHELKTPLAMIMGYAETLRDNPAVAVDTRQKFIGNIYNASLRLNNLINDVLELDRLESINGSEIVESVQLNDIAAEVEAFYAGSIEQTLTINSDDSAVFILPEHLMSILTNLIDNACKYSSGSEVIVNMCQIDNEVEISVDDSGPQIDSASRERIFERFYTCSTSRNKQYSGTGLGLSIVKHITGLYSGSVSVGNNDAGGNRFTVRLIGR